MKFTDKFDPEDYYLSPEGYIIFTKNTTSSGVTVVKAVAAIVRGGRRTTPRSENTHPDTAAMSKTLGTEKLDLTKTKTPHGTLLSCKGWIQGSRPSDVVEQP